MNSLKSNFPGVIVVPGTEGDLRSALRFAAKHRMRIAIRCSGLDYNGRSTGRGVMMIKTERLNGVVYDAVAQTATFSAGANHGDIYAALAPFNRVYVGALAPSVCPAGCLAGGCHGLLSRQYGLGIDSIQEIRFALFNGTVLTLNRTCNADLFHAYLGAGANSFGVALSFTAATYPSPPRIFRFSALFSILDPTAPDDDDDVEALARPNLLSSFFLNNTWFDSMPRGLAGDIGISGDVATIRFFYTGLDGDIVAPRRALAPLLQSRFTLHVEPIANYSHMYDAATANDPPVTDIWARKFFTNGFLRADDPRVLPALSRLVQAAKPVMWLWFMFGGAVSEHSTGSVPAGMRGAMYEVLFGSRWFDPRDDHDRMQYVSEFMSDLYELTDASYSNDLTTWGNLYNNIPDWQSRFFADYDSLMAVKGKYDPCNLYTVRYGVGSDLPLATCGLTERVGGVQKGA